MAWTNIDYPTHPLNIQVVESIVDGEVFLPCDISSRQNDSVYLVLWYRKDSGTPIYRLVQCRLIPIRKCLILGYNMDIEKLIYE